MPSVLCVHAESNIRYTQRRCAAGTANKSAIDLFRFHYAITVDTDAYRRVRSCLRAINPTMPNGISHAKYLILLSALQSFAVTDDEGELLLKTHHKAFADGFYSKRRGALM